MPTIRHLREKIGKGLYVDNLRDLGNTSLQMALDTAHPVPLFLLGHLFLDLARHWSGRPLQVEEAAALQSRIADSLNRVLDALELGAPPGDVLERLNILVSDYLSCAK